MAAKIRPVGRIFAFCTYSSSFECALTLYMCKCNSDIKSTPCNGEVHSPSPRGWIEKMKKPFSIENFNLRLKKPFSIENFNLRLKSWKFQPCHWGSFFWSQGPRIFGALEAKTRKMRIVSPFTRKIGLQSLRPQMPDIEETRKTAEEGAERVTVKQPKNSRKNSRNTQKIGLFFGSFGCFSGCFSAVLPWPTRSPFRLFFGCSQCRAFGTSVGGRRDCKNRGLRKSAARKRRKLGKCERRKRGKCRKRVWLALRWLALGSVHRRVLRRHLVRVSVGWGFLEGFLEGGGAIEGA